MEATTIIVTLLLTVYVIRHRRLVGATKLSTPILQFYLRRFIKKKLRGRPEAALPLELYIHLKVNAPGGAEFHETCASMVASYVTRRWMAANISAVLLIFILISSWVAV